QNCRLTGKKLDFDLRKPFDAIAEYANQSIGPPCWMCLGKWMGEILKIILIIYLNGYKMQIKDTTTARHY
ncbi:MAG: hypothetical protein Athens101410_790, partial [Parcubacteria group bacterium Athens1014_10]